MRYVITYKYKAADIRGVDCLIAPEIPYDIKNMAEQKLGFYIDWIIIQSAYKEDFDEPEGRVRR